MAINVSINAVNMNSKILLPINVKPLVAMDTLHKVNNVLTNVLKVYSLIMKTSNVSKIVGVNSYTNGNVIQNVQRHIHSIMEKLVYKHVQNIPTEKNVEKNVLQVKRLIKKQ